jgi:hypothetical protein
VQEKRGAKVSEERCHGCMERIEPELPKKREKKGRRTATYCGRPGRNDTLLLMDYDEDKVDEMVLALLYLTLHDGDRAWKGHDWDAMGRLHAKGMIGDPGGKAKSVWLTEEGLRRSRELFTRHFARESMVRPRSNST